MMREVLHEIEDNTVYYLQSLGSPGGPPIVTLTKQAPTSKTKAVLDTVPAL